MVLQHSDLKGQLSIRGSTTQIWVIKHQKTYKTYKNLFEHQKFFTQFIYVSRISLSLKQNYQVEFSVMIEILYINAGQYDSS